MKCIFVIHLNYHASKRSAPPSMREEREARVPHGAIVIHCYILSRYSECQILSLLSTHLTSPKKSPKWPSPWHRTQLRAFELSFLSLHVIIVTHTLIFYLWLCKSCNVIFFHLILNAKKILNYFLMDCFNPVFQI